MKRAVLMGLLCVMLNRVWSWSDAEDGLVSWGQNCAFSGDDLMRQELTGGPVPCATLCLHDDECSHYNWDQDSGNCHLLKVDFPPKYTLFRPVHSSGDGCGFVKTRVEAIRQKVLLAA